MTNELKNLCTELLNAVKLADESKVKNNNEPWTYSEDLRLANELQSAIAMIANNHSRTIKSIKARIHQNGLLLM